MTLELAYRGEPTVPVELPGLVPNALREKSKAEIERFKVNTGNRCVPLAEVFRVSGDPSDEHVRVTGELQAVHYLGAGMQSGRIEITGRIGRHVGSQMQGGAIDVAGDAGDWLGAEMRGGQIHVHGSAGDLVGAAYRGSLRGMTGGVILVDGDAGDEIGHTMRRGCIAVAGSLGQYAGYQMLAGTILTLASCGRRVGAGMRRGAIAVLGDTTPELLPTFRHAYRGRSPIFPVLLRSLAQRGFNFDPTLPQRNYDLYNGDFLKQGRGEVLVRTG